MTSTLEFYDDPARFLRDGDDFLDANPVETNVITVQADRAVRHGRGTAPHHWFALARDGSGAVCGAAMRTAPFEPYPLYVGPMSTDAARLLGTTLAARGENPGGVNGSGPAARQVADAAAAALGMSVSESMATRLWELGTLTAPVEVPGSWRHAEPADAALCLTWFNAFRDAANEQAGHSGGVDATHTLEDIERRIQERLIVLWVDGGEVVHLTAYVKPVFGVGRVGPVYTPPEHRGHGYAAAAVAVASGLIVDAGGRASLFTDLANPVSNRIYARLGYEPVADTTNLVLVDP